MNFSLFYTLFTHFLLNTIAQWQRKRHPEDLATIEFLLTETLHVNICRLLHFKHEAQLSYTNLAMLHVISCYLMFFRLKNTKRWTTLALKYIHRSYILYRYLHIMNFLFIFYMTLNITEYQH